MKKDKKKRRLSVAGALMWRISAIVLGLWFLTMSMLTVIVAQDQYDLYVADLEKESTMLSDLYVYDSEKGEYTDQLDISKLYGNAREFIFHFPVLDLPFYEGDYGHNLDNLMDNARYHSAHGAIFVFDKDNQPIFGKDGYGYVNYWNGEDWFNNDPITGSTCINMNSTECGRAVMKYWLRLDVVKLVSHNVYRLTGCFDGDEFVIYDAAYGDRWINCDFDDLREHYDYADLAADPQWDSFIEWTDLYDGSVPEDKEPVTIYVEEPFISDSGKEVRVNGKRWELEELAQAYVSNEILYNFIGLSSQQLDFGAMTEEISEETVRAEVKKYTKDNLWETVIFQTGHYLDESGNPCAYVCVAQFRPMRAAMLLLLWFYMLSLLPLLVLLFFIHRRIREDLKNPLRHVMKFAQQDYAALPDTVESDWLEIYELEQGYVKIQKDIHEYRKDITRLNTALDYAHNAEENRRRMVSDITHELKTPLAVIHSYAEGLKEGIAADKQDRYLEVILEEAERMDGMVLEMLDLSRLEAGKVRLSSDRFSLLELTKSVFEKLSPLVEDKSLQIEYIWPQDFEITADEGRMAQVVTNFATNAIKYSPEGGKIYIQITRYKERTSFTIGNQCEPLPEEALEKIWDSFYRTSASRTEKGTGLGLTITKAIVELHGGTCLAQNTADGVEFKFEIP